jgi:hypothetical protein
VSWFFRSLHLSRKERKDLKFFRGVLIFAGLGHDLTNLAHQENTYSEIFLLDRLKILIAFVLLWL